MDCAGKAARVSVMRQRSARIRALCTLVAAAAVAASLVSGCDRKQEPVHIAGDPGAPSGPGRTTATGVVPPSAGTGGPAASATSATVDTGVVRDGPGKLRIVRPPPDAEVTSFVRTERLRAKADGRVLVVYAGAKWCDPCKHFHALAYGGKLDARLSRMELLEFDVDADTERLAGAGYKYRFIPYFALAGADGHAEKEIAVKTSTMTDSALDELAAFQP